MERAIEWFVALTSLIIGVSHIVQARTWVEVFDRLHRAGRPGAFANGGLSLLPGAVLVAGHGSWAWPGAVVTAFGWLLVIKGMICFLVPDLALRSMERGPSRSRFVAGGAVLLAIAGWAAYCAWRHGGAG